MALTRVKPQGLQSTGVSFFATPTWNTGVNTYDYRNGPVFYHTTGNPSANWTANFTNVPTVYATNQSSNPAYGGMIVEVKIIATNAATGYYPNVMQIDGTSVAVTWQGGQAATNKMNIWTIQLVRVGMNWTKIIVKTVEAY